MIWRLRFLLAAALASTASCAAHGWPWIGWPWTPRPPSVEKIVAKAIAARGGAVRIQSINVEHLFGFISFSDGPAQRLLVEIMRPGRMRQEIGPERTAMIETTNGTTGWLVDPANGVREPRPLSPDQLANLASSADIDGPLIDYQSKGNRVELMGIEQVDGSDAYRVRVTKTNGDVLYADIDCGSFLQVRWQGVIHSPDGDHIAESYYRDYRSVHGVMFAFSITSSTQGQPSHQHIVLEDIELNPPQGTLAFDRP